VKTFEKYLESNGHSRASLSVQTRQLVIFLNWCDDDNTEPETVTHRDLIAYMRYLQQTRKIKQSSVQKYLQTVAHYLQWCIKRGLRQDNPARHIDVQGIQRKTLYHILNLKELETLYNNYPVESPKGPHSTGQALTAIRNKNILGLLIWQGLTSSELNQLTVNDLKLREGKIHIPGSRRSNERTLKLESHQVLDLMEYSLRTREELLKTTDTESSKLFITARRGGDTLQQALHHLRKQLWKQNEKITSLRQIRTSVITGWLKRYNLREVQQMAGHRYVSSTEAYLINDLEGLQEDITKYHPIG